MMRFFMIMLMSAFMLLSSTMTATAFTSIPSFLGRGLQQRQQQMSMAERRQQLTRHYSTVIEEPPVVVEEVVKDTKKDGAVEGRNAGNEMWEVRIYNDVLNTREHVARSLVQICSMSEITAYQTMMQAHQHGIAVVGRWVYEVAEMYHDQLRKSGIVCDIVPVDSDM